MNINYDHKNNLHTSTGAKAALSYFFSGPKPLSLLDVGCGTGTWLKAARELEIIDVYGIDGVAIPSSQLLVPVELFQQHDLTQPFNLNRIFDAVLCLEVAEHLEEPCSQRLIKSLIAHGKTIYFSAACPGQPGQHHVNCQWPSYWQGLFNSEGYSCDDKLRWNIWDRQDIEPWYRQNLFIATHAPSLAGREPRIKAVIHPEMASGIFNERELKAKHYREARDLIETGSEPTGWYLKASLKAARHKAKRKIFLE